MPEPDDDSDADAPYDDLPWLNPEDIEHADLPSSGVPIGGIPPVIVEWLGLLQNERDALKNRVLRLRSVTAMGLTAVLAQDPAYIRAMIGEVRSCKRVLSACQPSVCRAEGFHPLLDSLFSDIGRTAIYEGWERRGFRTTALRVVHGAMLIERLLLGMYELSHFQPIPAMAPDSWWIRELLQIE